MKHIKSYTNYNISFTDIMFIKLKRKIHPIAIEEVFGAVD